MVGEQFDIIRIIVIAIGVLLVMAVAIVLFFYFSRKRITQAEFEKVKLEIEYQKEVLQTTIITQEEERKRIAQDLHDAISSKLNIVSLNANILTEEGISSEETTKIATSIVNTTGAILENSRQIAHNLFPPTFDKFGLEAALEELCDEVSDGAPFNIRRKFQYKEKTLSKENELHLFRIVQELFNNAIKYSGASAVDLSMESDENQVSLEYKDDGAGFSVVEGKQKKGLGLSGIENRVSMLNGTYKILSAPSKGVQVQITVRL